MSEPVRMQIHPEVKRHPVNRYLYSHFAEHLGKCIYGGIWVGDDSKTPNQDGIRLDTADALKQVALPALRYPGGCFADNYHWMDGVGPRQNRPKRHNLWWKQPESNQFGTDEFMRFCAMIGTEPYLCLNVGSGTVEEARSWVEYCNANQETTLVQMRVANGQAEPYHVKFWGIGNENWGCGGHMQPEYYADLYRQFATYVRPTAGEDARLIACGSHTGIPDWDERFLNQMKGALHLVDSIALHIYVGGGTEDVNFQDSDYLSLIASIDIFDKALGRACGLVQAYSTSDHPIGVVLDEWGTWYRQATVEKGLYQQNTMRDVLFTAASFHCFHLHGDKLWMTNMAQTINVLQALILTRGPQAICTPTYHVYEMFQPHRDSQAIPVNIQNCPTLSLPDGKSRDRLSTSATVSEDGKQVFLSLVNLDLSQPVSAICELAGKHTWKIKQARRLGSNDIHAHNTFEDPTAVTPVELDTVKIAMNALDLPAQSITTLLLEREA